MTVSREDAFGLLSKWKSESTPVAGVLTLDGVGVTFGGFITDLLSYALVVTQFLKPEFKCVEVLIGLDSVINFEYQDLREAPAHLGEKFKGKIAAVLVIHLPTAQCCLYEMEKSPG